ncbi:uncharacterized protein [Amphiura filiformis]|uniref:uncharacterized protein n=1 Tax=Amphiura filiformis TaxID=82378 RepID=UPI003B21F01F
MAQPQSLIKLLECQICTEIFNENDRKPKMLPCQHTVCLHCMKQWARNEFREASYGDLLSVHTVIKCPTCTAEHDAPENDVDKFANNITMISFLSIAPAEEDASSTLPRNDGDIKQCLEDRVQRLRDKIAEAQVSYIKKLSAWDTQIMDAKKIISTHCAQFKQAIEHREEALVKQLDEFSARRQTSYEGANADFSRELMEMSSFCDRVEQQLKGASQRQTTRNLDKCLEMLETLEITDDSDQGATNGAKWVAKFNPDRKDTVHASIAMFGQLILQDPGSTPKKKPVAFGNRNRKTRHIYTREFLLGIQPSCCSRKPPILVNFPEITPVMPDVKSLLQMNQILLEKRPLTLNLVNIYHKPQTVQIRQTAHEEVGDMHPFDNEDIPLIPDTEPVGYRYGNPHRNTEPDQDDEIEWCPPRLLLGSTRPTDPRYYERMVTVPAFGQK